MAETPARKIFGPVDSEPRLSVSREPTQETWQREAKSIGSCFRIRGRRRSRALGREEPLVTTIPFCEARAAWWGLRVQVASEGPLKTDFHMEMSDTSFALILDLLH